MRWFWAAPVTLLLWVAWGQAPQENPKTPAVLENSGKPMRPPLQCTDEDIQVAGLSCTEEEPCPIYLELSALEPVGNKIVTVGNLHSDAATLSSILLLSSDNGKTWREPFERVRGATLERAQFVDFEHGWVAGETVQPLPRDPFILITADGGKTWRRQAIFDDARPGSILQVWFDSPTSGALVFDRGSSGDGPRYELYESPTGGDNWMVREASGNPIRIKRMPAEPGNSDWRLRSDSATKANRIEKRQGAGWAPIASFAVEVGMCKPPAVKEPEPPPEIPPDPNAEPAEKGAEKGTLSLPALRGDPASSKKRPQK